VELESGLPLGITDNAEYEETAFTLGGGDRVTLMTDGVVEARSAGGELFGFARTCAISGESAERIAAAAQTFGQEDDITVLAITLAPANERRV
jgi:serine phosphatase RsbU (regulator of sigma subunit)